MRVQLCGESDRRPVVKLFVEEHPYSGPDNPPCLSGKEWKIGEKVPFVPRSSWGRLACPHCHCVRFIDRARKGLKSVFECLECNLLWLVLDSSGDLLWEFEGYGKGYSALRAGVRYHRRQQGLRILSREDNEE